MSNRFLFLASRLQPFLVAGLRSLLAEEDTEVLLLFDRSNEEAPVEPEYHPRLRVFSFLQEPDPVFWDTIATFRPDIVYCAGWMYTRYMGWCRELKRSGATTICAMDTQWKGTLKQRLWCITAPLLLRKCFTDAWVPGARQADYARRLGFTLEHIHQDLYAPDTALFSRAYQVLQSRQDTDFPKTFLYAGRLVPHKLLPLLTAFCALSAEERQGWQLVIHGNGPLQQHPLLQHPAISLAPFCQQEQLAKVMSAGGVCCLCSSHEPWGTIVPEAAAAGMPLVVSVQCGSQPHFLEDGINGFACTAGDNNSVREALLKIIRSDDKALWEMSAQSHRLGARSGSADWAQVLLQLAGK